MSDKSVLCEKCGIPMEVQSSPSIEPGDDGKLYLFDIYVCSKCQNKVKINAGRVFL